MAENKRSKRSGVALRSMVLCGMFSALIALCAWLSIPAGHIAFTMQTFGVFLALEVLGGKWGTVSILIYLLLGMAGAPVFAGFQGGLYPLVGPTGGFLWGFLLAGAVYWAAEKLCKPLGVILGMLVCYFCGCWWFQTYALTGGFRAAAVQCVVPYLIPDGIKLTLARSLAKRLRRHIKM